MSSPQRLESLMLCLQIDGERIYQYCGKINEEEIVKNAKNIENILKQNGASPDKIQNVFELFVESMQNMLNYSYGTIELENNKRESNCNFSLSYDTQENSYILESCNLIQANQKENIEKNLDQIQGLDKMALRKLARKKVRSRKDTHDKGAGLGFIIMARKSLKPIEVTFIPQSNNIFRYRQKLVI